MANRMLREAIERHETNPRRRVIEEPRMNKSTLSIFMSMCLVFGMVSCNPATNTPTASSSSKVTAAVGRIVFQSERDGNAEIYVMNADGTGLTRLTDNPAFDGMPCFRWDGRRIAFTSERDGNLDIYSMKANGTDLTRLTNHPSADFSPYYSSDGRFITFGSDRGTSGSYSSYTMNAFGKVVAPSKQWQSDDAMGAGVGSPVVFHARDRQRRRFRGHHHQR